jgi:S-adenosylmethionine:diacylglycerol 3-amino-3-carboxypropyl transferase
MSTTTTAATLNTLNSRVLEEGYGAEAWHGPNLKAALTDVSPELASWRPAAGRHSIVEIAIHHAYYAHAVRGRLAETAPEPFVLDGEDWFTLSGANALSWKDVLAVVDTQQQRLATLVSDIEAGRVRSRLSDAERFALVLGITCHAVYHAGQVQLIKRLHARD